LHKGKITVRLIKQGTKFTHICRRNVQGLSSKSPKCVVETSDPCRRNVCRSMVCRRNVCRRIVLSSKRPHPNAARRADLSAAAETCSITELTEVSLGVVLILVIEYTIQ